MLEFTLNSRTLGQELTFTQPGQCYVWLQFGNGERQQICEGGRLSGATVMFTGGEDGFKRMCRKWYRSYMKAVAR